MPDADLYHRRLSRRVLAGRAAAAADPAGLLPHAFWWQHPRRHLRGLERQRAAPALRALDRWITPARLRQHCTIVHDDGPLWNLLYSRDGVPGGVRLIGWSNWRVVRGVGDIAYMMAVHWYPEQRARLEAPLSSGSTNAGR